MRVVIAAGLLTAALAVTAQADEFVKQLEDAGIAVTVTDVADNLEVVDVSAPAHPETFSVQIIEKTDPGALALITEPERRSQSPGAEYAIDNFDLITASVSGLMPMPSGGAAASGHYIRSLT